MESNFDLKNYRNAIADFEKYIKNIYSSNSIETEHKGYLINFEEYENIKVIIDNFEVNINDCGQIFHIKQIEFKTPQYLIYMILNGNKYILINTDFWRLICDKDKINESPIVYRINDNDITFKINNKELSFSHNKNIIDKKSLNSSSDYISNYENITKIYDSIINYYNFENTILKSLSYKHYPNDTTNEYLLSNEWIDKWKKLSNYEYIKTKYLQYNLNNKENIMNNLILYLENNKLNYNELFGSINIRKFDKEEELKSYLKKDSLVLIDRKFIDIFVNFTFLNNFKSTKFKAFNNQIHIYLEDNEVLSFKSNNNIISLNEIINYSYLKQLIKIFYIQNKIRSNVEKDSNSDICLINKKVINIYKDFFNYKQLYDFLKNDFKNKRINYDNLEKYYYKIINNLDDDYITQYIQLDQNKILNELKDVNENFTECEYKINSPKEKKMKYIMNFEIVDEDIRGFFIRNKIAKKEHFIPLYSYLSQNGKIFFIFSRDNKNFYEIGHFNDNEEFIIEYLIDELEKSNKESIADYFLDKGIDPFITDSNESKRMINLKEWWTTKQCISYKIDLKEIQNEKIYRTPDAYNNNNIKLAYNAYDGMRRIENMFKTSLNNSYLINKNNIEEPNKNGNMEFNINNDNKVNKYISYIIIIQNEYLKIEKELNKTLIIPSNRQENEEEYYLINRNYMKELENILHFKEIINEINIDEINKLDLDINNINNEIINEIKGGLKEKLINYLITLDEKKLIINDENKYEISPIESFDNENSKLFYYNNCQIINKKIYLLLSQIDQNLSNKIMQIRCVLNNQKIIIFNNDKIINTGYLNEDNTFIIEHIIYSESKEDISKIFEIFKIKGYEFIQEYLSIKKIETNVNNNILEAKIYSLLGGNDTRKYFSSKLKTLVLLSLFNQKKVNYNKSNNSEKVFLMNKEWLFQYKYEVINLLLIENEEKLEDYLNEEKISNLSIDSIQMNEIISLLGYDSIYEIDASISKISRDNEIPYQAQTEKLKLNKKEITIYANFVMANEEIVKSFKKNFGLKNLKYNTYLQHINGDIIINKFSQQNLILFGNINYKEYTFNIKFIFDFEKSKMLDNELEYLMKNEIKDYIKNKTLFNEKNESDIISPIFDNDKEIGYCYKYYSNMQNPNYNNFYDYKNYNLLKAIKLYFYYQTFSEKIKKTKSDNKEFYLINNNLMSEIKNNYKYNEIKEILDNINFKDINNKKILAIKSLSNDIIKYFKENNKIKNKYKKDLMEPNIIPINDLKTGKAYKIYNKFEILEREMAQDLINEIYRVYSIGMNTIIATENNYLKCEINEGKIIIHYPQNFNNNNKYISIIGEIENDNHFLNEFILIYIDSSSKSWHMNHIKGNLNKYLSNLQLHENSEPIIDKNYKEIGIIIKLSNEIVNNNSNNLAINTKEIKSDINNNMSKTTFNKEPHYSLKKNENDIKKTIFNEPINNENENENEDEYNLDYQTDSPEIRTNFSYPPKMGLQNIGATCYMNATLQCFCHIEKFINFFKYSQQVISMVRNNKNNLTSSFKLLIEKLWPNNHDESYPQKYYAPEEFKNKISKLNPLFEGIAANDAKDLVNFIIMTLHQELNKAEKRNTNNNNILDQRNQLIMFNNFVQNFASENQSIISDLFYGINCNITQCCNCNSNIYNYQIYFFLIFPLEEVRKFKNNNIFNNPVNIYDCFDYDRKINLMYGDNSMYCNYCRQNTNCKMCTCLTTGPEILILLLNRGHGIEFNVKINFMEELDLSNYIEYKNTGFKYKLIGVITHIGESGMGGHFIAYCKDPISMSWNKYNDAIVSEVHEQDFQREVINFAMPYLLFYQKY